jgi:chromosome segregation ATPase
VLYLAEIQKQKSGFNISGKAKAELKLLACQRTEQNWSAIPGEELIPAADDANNFNHGVLVLVDMNANRQIQSQLRDAGKHLVGILQNLSRQIEKYKKEADEIESWRQSLSLQSQQLQLRQEEIYTREEELEQTRAELDRLTQEAQALESTINHHEQQRQEIAAKWEELQQREARLEQMQQSGSMLSEQQAAEIRAALQQLGTTGAGLNPQQLESTASAIEFQQDLLHQHWERLHQQQQRMTETQAEIDSQQQDLDRRKQELQELENSLEQAQTEWEVQQHTLTMQQEYAQRLTARIELERESYQRIYLMSKGGGTELGEADKIDIEQLENMPIAELETIVASLQKEVEQAVYFVNLEEEELHEKHAAIDEIQQQIATANEFDRLKLEAELADEQEGYNMLEHTLDGQRQTLKERQAVLQIHSRVLRQRQGHPPDAQDRSQIEWEAVLQLLDRQREEQESELTNLESEVQNLRATLEQAKLKVEQQVNEYLVKSEEVQKLERQLQASKKTVTELGAQIELYQEMIQPLQNHLNTFKEQIAALTESGGSQPDLQAMAKIDSLLTHLVHGDPAAVN